MSSEAPKIIMVAGEASSDLLGADLITQLKQQGFQGEIQAVGGARMRSTGVSVFQDNEAFAVMGLFEVLKDLPRLLRLKRQIVDHIIAEKPDVFIGIDSPDLNFAIAKSLKKHGIKVIHYVSPSVWAWRPKRVFKMARFIDMVMCLFPFEPEIYQEAHLPAQFVGHPLAQKHPIDGSKPNNQPPLLAILPGSRSREIKTLMPLFLETAKQFPDWQLASANVSKEKIQKCEAMAQEAGVKLKWFDQADDLLQQADFALLGSGTVALEAMLCRTPMVVAYRIAAMTWWLVRIFNMLKLPYYSLPNVLHGGLMVPEVMQGELNSNNLEAALQSVSSSDQQQALLARFKSLHQSLMPPEPQAAAQAVLRFLEEQS